jgi:mono/diheme cytochrome c family protein
MKTFVRLLPICLMSLGMEGAELTRAESEFFEKEIRPIFANNCYRCHSREAKSLKGSLYLDSREGLLRGGESGLAIVPESPEKSLLIQAIRHEAKIKMPPKSMLKEKEIQALEKWIRMGAPDPGSKNNLHP